MKTVQVSDIPVGLQRFINNLCPGCEYYYPNEKRQCRITVGVTEKKEQIVLTKSTCELDMSNPVKKKKECKRKLNYNTVSFKSLVTS